MTLTKLLKGLVPVGLLTALPSSAFATANLASDDFVGISFWLISMAMLSATIFFLWEVQNVEGKWKTSLVVGALVCFIAAVHYFYMREQWVLTGESPTELRYIDWILTVPLMVVEFALLTGVGMRKLFWASVIMLVTGYFGESGVMGGTATMWGTASALAYFYMAYEVGCLTIFGGPTGAVGTALNSASGKIPSAGRMLQWFVLVGWAIYPLGYLMGTDAGQWYEGMSNIALDMNVVYNVGDAINKIGFGMAVWSAARS